MYKIAEVKEHNTPEDLWCIIHDKVYNVTKFLSEVIDFFCKLRNFGIYSINYNNAQHPGGEEVLIEAGGKNATKDFDEVGHSVDAK